MIEEEKQSLDEALIVLKSREDKVRDDKQARSVELADCIRRGEESAASIVARFVGDVSQIVSAHHCIDEAVAVLSDRIIPQPLMTKDRIKQLREALTLLQKEFGL